MSETPLLGLPMMESSQAQKHVTHNEALLLLDASIHLSVISRGETAPPVMPVDGNRFLIAIAGTGDWTGHDGELALREAGSWRFTAPRTGWRLWVQDEAKFLVFDGSVWLDLQNTPDLSNILQLGVNTPADPSNRLAVASDAVLFSNAGSDQRLKINKQAVSDTGSLLFQTNYSGRTEMGLAGDDDFHVKVSADGGVWNEAIVVDAATGVVSLPNTPPGNISDGDKGDILVGAAGGTWEVERTGGAAGDGVTDDTAALQSVLSANKTVVLGHGKSYLITSRLNITGDGTGIVGDGTARLIMSTAAGHFDNASGLSSARYGTNAVAIRADNVSRPVVKGVRIAPDAWVDDRYVKALTFAGCSDVVCDDNEAWGFSRAKGIFAFMGCAGGSVSGNHIHTSYTNSTSGNAADAQITGIQFDGDLASVAPQDSTAIRVEANHIHDLTVDAVVVATLGYQTDGINVTSDGEGLVITRNIVSTVGEGLDTFANGALIFGNRFDDCYYYGIKLVHGASRNTVSGNEVNRPGIVGINIASSNAAGSTDLLDNRVIGNTVRGVNAAGVFAPSSTAGIRISNVDGDTWFSKRTIIQGNDIDCGGTGGHGIWVNSVAKGAAAELRRNRIRNFVTADLTIVDATEVLHLNKELAAASTLRGNVLGTSAEAADLSPAAARNLLNVADGATANADDAALRDRSSHTGTQLSATISDFNIAADARMNAGISTHEAAGDPHPQYLTSVEGNAAFAALAHGHAASDITSGTIAPVRLGSGTPDATTFLRGDNTWAAPSGSHITVGTSPPGLPAVNDLWVDTN